jgi:hypothetical protein
MDEVLVYPRFFQYAHINDYFYTDKCKNTSFWRKDMLEETIFVKNPKKILSLFFNL